MSENNANHGFLTEKLRIAAESGHRVLTAVHSTPESPSYSAICELAAVVPVSGDTAECICVAPKQKLRAVREAVGRSVLVVPPDDAAETALGRTFDAVFLVDAHGLPPNTVAQTVETVRGGGLVVLLGPPLADAGAWRAPGSDCLNRYTSALHKEVSDSLYGARLRTSLLAARALELKADLAPLEETATEDEDSDEYGYSSEADYSDESGSVSDASTDDGSAESDGDSTPAALLSMCRTPDQARALRTLAAPAPAGTVGAQRVVAVTAGRGRGKSAALGLAVARALAEGRTALTVVAPAPENVQTLFEFTLRGLRALGFTERELRVARAPAPGAGRRGAQGPITGVTVVRRGRRCQAYFALPSAAAASGCADMLVIDEAAAIPLPVVRTLLGLSGQAARAPQLVIMASTVHGYEGTGRALSLKLLASLRGRPDFASAELATPIRYGPGCPVERWLNDLLLLDSDKPAPAPPSAAPARCALVCLSKDALFDPTGAGVRTADAEALLSACYGTLVASHYRNSPNDLRLLADCPSHALWALVPPQAAAGGAALVGGRGRAPPVLAVIQTALEGGIPAKRALRPSSGGRAGDMLPWSLVEQTRDAALAGAAGLRVVRIAVPDEFSSMGYGSAALAQLKLLASGALAGADVAAPWPGAALGAAAGAALAVPARALAVPPLGWVGTSFGLTASLARFWSRAGLRPVHVRHDANPVTAEHSAAWIWPVERATGVPYASPVPVGADAAAETAEDDRVFGVVPPSVELMTSVNAATADCRRRLAVLLGGPLQRLPTSLAAALVVPTWLLIGAENSARPAAATEADVRALFSSSDLERLGGVSEHLLDLDVVADLLPLAGALLVERPLPNVALSAAAADALVAMALAGRSVADFAVEAGITDRQAAAHLAHAMLACARGAASLVHEADVAEAKLSAEAQWAAISERGVAPRTVTIARTIEPGQAAAGAAHEKRVAHKSNDGKRKHKGHKARK